MPRFYVSSWIGCGIDGDDDFEGRALVIEWGRWCVELSWGRLNRRPDGRRPL